MFLRAYRGLYGKLNLIELKAALGQLFLIMLSMNYIEEIIKKENPTFDELISCFEIVKDDGNIGFIKLDGERDKDHYTIIITFPENREEMLRSDGADLKQQLKNVLSKYINRP